MSFLPELSPNIMALGNVFALACAQTPKQIDLSYSLLPQVAKDANSSNVFNKGKQSKYPRAWVSTPLNSTIALFENKYTEKFNISMVFAISAVETRTKAKPKDLSYLEGTAMASATAKNFLVALKSILVQPGFKNKIELDTKSVQFSQGRMVDGDETCYRSDVRFMIEMQLESPCNDTPGAILPPFDTLTGTDKPIIDKDILKYE